MAFISEILSYAGGALCVLGFGGIVIAYYLRNGIDSEVSDEILERTVNLVACGFGFMVLGGILGML